MKKYIITVILIFVIIFIGFKSCNLITKRKINNFNEQAQNTNNKKNTEEFNTLTDEIKDDSSTMVPEFRYYDYEKERTNKKSADIPQTGNTESDSVSNETPAKQPDTVFEDKESEKLSNESNSLKSDSREGNTTLYQAFKSCTPYESSYDGTDKKGANIRYMVSIEPIRNTPNCTLKYNATKWDKDQTYESVRKSAAASVAPIFSKEMDPCFICEFSPEELKSFYELFEKKNMPKSHNTVGISFVGMNLKGEKIYESEFYFRNFNNRDFNLLKTIIENKGRCQFGVCCFGKECGENAYKKYH